MTPPAAGFTRIHFRPDLGDLDWAVGTIPTPQGPIHTSLTRKAGGLYHASLDVPEDMEILVPDWVQVKWNLQKLLRLDHGKTD